MKETLKLIIVLSAICVVAGALLAVVNHYTADRINQTEENVKMRAILKVLPECDNNPLASTVTVSHAGSDWTFYVAGKNGAFAGAAVETRSASGYGGDIVVMLGINAAQEVQSVEILQHKETPGLGAKIGEQAFRGQFAGKSIGETRWAVRKDGGDIDAVTAATISSRAVADAVQKGLQAYSENRDAVVNCKISGGKAE